MPIDLPLLLLPLLLLQLLLPLLLLRASIHPRPTVQQPIHPTSSPAPTQATRPPKPPPPPFRRPQQHAGLARLGRVAGVTFFCPSSAPRRLAWPAA